MKSAAVAFLGVHGLIHLLGVAKAFRLAELPQLTQPISHAMGVLWLAAGLAHVVAAVLVFAAPRWWWAVGAAALVLSMAAIMPSWSDAKFGAAANAVVLIGVVIGFYSQGPASLRHVYDQEVGSLVRSTAALDTRITGEDLAHLPGPVRRYLEATGVVGGPRVHNFRARMHGRIRSAPDSTWMPFSAEQHNGYGPATRLFYLDASMFRLPVHGLHRYVGSSASMLIKVLGLLPVSRMSGAEMTRAETVTLLNDMCVLAPATLIDPSIGWEPLDHGMVRATFTNAGHTVRAELQFDDSGFLVDFRSEDRPRAAPDGRSVIPARWSTPLRDYRDFGGARLASAGEARYADARDDFAYIEMTIEEVVYNVPPN